jgi:hypothetical protein
MQPRSSFDRTLLIPIAIGVVSILGIGWLFLTGAVRETLNPPTAVPTAVPFDAGSLATEAAFFFPSATATLDETLPTATETLPLRATIRAANTLINILITESPATASATPTPNQVQPLAAGRRYDDTDPNIFYDQFWTVLKNSSTVNAYKGTLHASNSIGNEAFFRFIGTSFRLGYQRGMNFGTVTVLIDGEPYSFHEQDPRLVWRSPQLAPGDHLVRIIHESGESINLDYIEILDVSYALSYAWTIYNLGGSGD